MYKKVLGGIAVLAIAAVAAMNVNLNTTNADLSDTSLSNIEAFAAGDCEYTNGYRRFGGGSGGAYDCCLIWREGSASDSCH
ncbi:MAG: NVEALA domain-containing protein [Dysgonamonadaceae bacterium]|jgi:hypothetical protein|nr:NVEALA domain-containing protein [Dysgonamonadaceae bacterium]